MQKTVERLYDSLSTLSDNIEKGYSVGGLRWNSPREYQSITYSQSVFTLKNTSGQTATLWLSKIGDIDIRHHRPIPDSAIIKAVTLKEETTGEWYVTFGLDVEDTALPEKPDVDELERAALESTPASRATSTRQTVTAWTGSTSPTNTNACDENNATSSAKNAIATTVRNSGAGLLRSGVESGGRLRTSSTDSRDGPARDMTPCSWRI